MPSASGDCFMRLSRETLATITHFIESSFREHENGELSIFDSELGDYASDCSIIQLSSFLARMGRLGIAEKGIVQSSRLVTGVVSRANDKTWFGIPYNSPIGEDRAIDIAELGASARSAGYLANHIDSELGSSLLNAMVSRLESFESQERIGAYRKNQTAKNFDVLNGDLYAALVLSEAYKATGISNYAHKMFATIRHLIDRFDENTSQWPYSEYWDGTTLLGMSVAYQATITGWGRSISGQLPRQLGQVWDGILSSAEGETIRQLENGRTTSNEVPSWVSPWEGVWEIWQALELSRDSDFSRDWIQARLLELESGFGMHGVDYLGDSRPPRINRTVIGSKLRMVSNLAAILLSVEDQNLLS